MHLAFLLFTSFELHRYNTSDNISFVISDDCIRKKESILESKRTKFNKIQSEVKAKPSMSI